MVLLSVCLNLDPTGRIVVGIYNGVFYVRSVPKAQIWLKSDKNFGETYILKYVYIVDSTEYFVTRQQCKGHALL